MTTWGGRRPGAARGFTLLEVMLALAIAGLLAAAALPYLLDAFPAGPEPAEELRAAARRARFEALRHGEARRLVIAPEGFLALDGSKEAILPPGWSLEIRRAGEARFRKPRKGESWEFNSEGLCEPIEVRLRGGGGQEAVAAFDPLTALEPPGTGG
ncbi:MAG: prepilin-type N-terminal cleavage/methylation domain-containing protein [Terrimicrobiaceae bacterium]|nr:prepilin-type N-terminal cleavage/methylation domain-containing protein [Terrimicrobiaceae bacterium]